MVRLFWPILAKWPVLAVSLGSGGETQKSAMGTMGALLFGNKSAMGRPMGTYGHYGQAGGAFGKTKCP